jgi:RNA polymerase sigma factor (TIGR02999 family)
LAKSAVSVTDLLKRVADGSKDAEAALIDVVYRELHHMARGLMRREGHNHTLQATALVNEAYLRLARPATAFNDRPHFFAVAATVMRRILVDYARAKHAEKRDVGVPASIDVAELSVSFDQPERMRALDAALSRLSQLDECQERIVELRFFAGMTTEETADALQIYAASSGPPSAYSSSNDGRCLGYRGRRPGV